MLDPINECPAEGISVKGATDMLLQLSGCPSYPGIICPSNQDLTILINGEILPRYQIFLPILFVFAVKSSEPICDKYSNVQYNLLGNAYCACPDCTTSSSSVGSMVCASDGLTYAGSCWVKRAACLKREDIVVVKDEPCGE